MVYIIMYMSTTNRTKKNGNSKDRAARSQRLEAETILALGRCACVHCGLVLRRYSTADRIRDNLTNGQIHSDQLTVDRIIPETDGGRYVWGNICPACPACNKARQDTPLDEWCGVDKADRIRGVFGGLPRKRPPGFFPA